MNLQQSLLTVALFVAFFVFGFLGSLGLHWSIRPSLEQVPAATVPSTGTSIGDTGNSLSDIQQQLNQSVMALETELDRVETEHDIDEGHARALILELQSYREERDALFSDLEARKQKVINKIDELDAKIQQQLDQRDTLLSDVPDYELENELVGLLNYPHSLNDQPELSRFLMENPAPYREFIEQRFELMLQQVDYRQMDRLYEVLDPLIERLNEQHANDTKLTEVHCSQYHCELQVSLQRLQPYFDYWQQWLVELRKLEPTKLIKHELVTENDQAIHGSVIVQRL